MGGPSTLASFAPIAGAGLGLVGSVIGNIQSSKNVDKQIEAQRKENAANRDFNAKQAQLNRDYQTGQILDYRQYNSPLAQVKRLQEAGFHPTAALGQMSPSDAGLSSGSAAASSGGISPVGYSPLDVTSSARSLAETRLLNAQADAAEAKATKDEADTNTIDSMRDGLVTLQNIEIEFAPKLKEVQLIQLRSIAEKLNQDISESKERINQIVAQTNVLKQHAISTELDNAWKDKTFDTRVKQESARLHISEQEYRYMVASFTMRLANLGADTNSKLASALRDSAMGKMLDSNREINEKRWDMFHQVEYNIKVNENQRLLFDLQLDRKWKDTERQLNVYNSSSETARRFMDIVGRGIETWNTYHGRPASIGFRR